MATALQSSLPSHDTQLTLADVLARVPNVPAHRICLFPTPGTATEDDAVNSKARFGSLCELINGTLVRKAMGSYESILACELIRIIGTFIEQRKLGKVAAPDGPMRVVSKLRYPDVAFYSWERLKQCAPQRGKSMKIGPDLAIEVLSPDNTPEEMEEKLRDYFKAKVRLVWYIDPKTKTVRVYRSLKRLENISARGSLKGGDVLPGFSLKLAELFAGMEPPT